MTPIRLKRMTLEMLKTRCAPDQARKLIENFKDLYQNRKHVFCKVNYMIYLNMIGWRDIDKMEFLSWYHRQLRLIVSGKR